MSCRRLLSKRERDGCLIPCIASAAMDNGGKTTFWMTWLWMDLFLPSLFIPLTSGSQLAEECWDITSLRFFYFHLFLFFFFIIFIPFCCWFETERGRSQEETRESERVRDLCCIICHFEVHRGGYARWRKYMVFSLMELTVTSCDRGKKKKKRRIICRPAWRYECHGFHTHVHQTLSHTRTHTKVNECERICMCYSCVQRCKEMRSESKIFFVCFLDLNWERERERENLNLISFFGNCSLSDFGSFVCDWHWAGAKLAGFR